MKYAVILCDGMADYPIPALDGKTPLQVAKKPNMDALAARGKVGLCRTVPFGMKPGSDVANLSVMGYDPKIYYTGRSPLEAVSIGINLKPTDTTLRANLVTLSEGGAYEDKTMVDYSAGEIHTEDARMLIEYLKPHLENERYKLYAGVSYRHCLVIDNGKIGNDLTPPHDISDRPVKEYLPKGIYAEELLALMKKSNELLSAHPYNVQRVKEGKRPANSLWFWGEGTKPMLTAFEELRGLKGGVISAVDLIRGVGILADMKVIEVPNITGNYTTNFQGKADACADALLNGLDFVYLHMEAPDECGHQGDLEHKIWSIEEIDRVVIKTVVEKLRAAGEDFTILVAPDHPTPIAIKTHCSDPVPFLIYRSNAEKENAFAYDEEGAKNSGVFVESGVDLMQEFLS
ncbi:MAG: cofactor-independent phosphoglycerate mutase [Clostridiales bacterium]|nr:cofactor-independent phosphoglycerate mutase [Clostridiales bacterium]